MSDTNKTNSSNSASNSITNSVTSNASNSTSNSVTNSASNIDSSNSKEETVWIKRFSKTHQRDYWYNEKDKISVWQNPLKKRKLEDDSDTKTEKEEVVTKESCAVLANTDTTKRSKVEIEISIAIIVPFRDLQPEQKRQQHLQRFIPEITNFLSSSDNSNGSEGSYGSYGSNRKVTFKIFIIEQSNDNRKFNRGKLLNIGYDIAKKNNCNVFIFHDVDLLPSQSLLPSYTTLPIDNPIHIARAWGRYTKNPKYFGGVVSFSKEMFESINGFPNNFWGWGGEDDELYSRTILVSKSYGLSYKLWQ